jgi:hypothetical protein
MQNRKKVIVAGIALFACAGKVEQKDFKQTLKDIYE